MKRIVVLPIFNEGHFLPYFIDNVVSVLGATHIIFNDGLFPTGPEYQSSFTTDFYQRFTIEDRWSFDLDLVESICEEKRKQYPNVSIQLNKMFYDKSTTAKDAFYLAFTSNLPTLSSEDLLFPLEADFFVLDIDKNNLDGWLDTLQLNEGLSIECLRFFESPSVRMLDFNTTRRLAIRWGDGNFYHAVVHNILFDDSNVTSRLRRVNFLGFHYDWVRPDSYFEARVGMLVRPAGFWERVISNRDFIMVNHTIPPNAFVPMEMYFGPHAKALYEHSKWKEYNLK